MCNAWNHSLDCTCGWGGDGHTGRRTIGNTPFLNIGKPTFKTYREFFDSCTIPNAKCPVCGDPVFFYRSPSNGRVFFDELGPPWPKHPCTISPHRIITTARPVNLEVISNPMTYFVDGKWKPFLVECLINVDLKHNILEIVGYVGDLKKSFFTKLGGITTDFPFFINESESEVRLITFDPSSENYLFEFVVKKYRSELTESILSASSSLPKDQIRSRPQGSLNQRPIPKNPKKGGSNNQKDKAHIKNVRPTSPKLQGKLQDQLSKLKETFKSE